MRDADTYTPDNADPDATTELELAGPGWALFDLDTDDGGHRCGEIQADQESGIFNELVRNPRRVPGGPDLITVTRDDRAHWQVAYDYARMRAMLERVSDYLGTNEPETDLAEAVLALVAKVRP